jgi:hypothetical protein
VNITFLGFSQPQTLAGKEIPKAEFAFVSACQTVMGERETRGRICYSGGWNFPIRMSASAWSIREENGPKIVEDVGSSKTDRKEATYTLYKPVK